MLWGRNRAERLPCLEVFFSCGRSFSQWKIDSHIFCHDNDDNFVHTFLNFTKISTFEAVFSTDTLLFTPKVELLFSHALRKYENVVLEKYLSPPPELGKSAERSECSFSMRMKSNSAPKQILVTTSPELGKWESCPVTLKSFLDTLWWRWVNTSCYKMISMYVRGLISRFQWVSVSFQWGEALQRFCTRSRGVAKAVSVFAKVKKSTNTEMAMLSSMQCNVAHNAVQCSCTDQYWD